MGQTPYLTFSLTESTYGLDALQVQEIFFLPEVTPLAETSPDLVGILNLRGTILPVLDLRSRLGHPRQDYQPGDSVIVIRWQDTPVGIIAHQVHQVQMIDEAIISPIPVEEGQSPERQRLIAGVVRADTQLILLLNVPAFSCLSGMTTEQLETRLRHPEAIASHYFAPTATAAQRQLYRQRAENLVQSSAQQDMAGLLPIAVVGLNGEFFGLDLDCVREFTDVRQITPVPCCPPHIIGNMNLRGEIVTLVDIRPTVNLAETTAANTTKAVITAISDVVAGIPIDDVLDITYINASDLQPVPAATRTQTEEFLRGTVPFGDRMVSVLDLRRILLNGDLMVNEEA